MRQLTLEGQQTITAMAQRYGVSVDAVMTLLEALVRGQGTMAQFNHSELGGTGQWMQGGMTMVGDMFNHALKAKVDGLCSDLARLLAHEPLFRAPSSGQMQTQGGRWPAGGEGPHGLDRVSLFVPGPSAASADWWPADLGSPTATGSQNGLRYAYFAEKRRLAVALNGHVTVYDTLDHQISGVSQQQGTGASLTFTSQRGVVRLSELPPVVPAGKDSTADLREAPADTRADVEVSTQDDIFAKIERLAELKQKGILSEDEFATKKAELLRRL